MDGALESERLGWPFTIGPELDGVSLLARIKGLDDTAAAVHLRPRFEAEDADLVARREQHRRAGILCENRAQPVLVGAGELGNLLAAAVEFESGHGADAALRGRLLVLVDVHLGKVGKREVARHGFEFWADHLAWATPRRREVDGEKTAAICLCER